jgi:predicted AAA+ superfamily ATPase
LRIPRVVVLLSARQVGKSTLVAQIAAGEPGRLVITLDDEATRRGAIEDQTGFVADLDTPVAIDEVQRAPGLLLAIKQSVDADQRPGRYLLTGSANILTAPTIADALTGPGVPAQRERRARVERSSDRRSVDRDVRRHGDRASAERRSRSAPCLSLS